MHLFLAASHFLNLFRAFSSARGRHFLKHRSHLSDTLIFVPDYMSSRLLRTPRVQFYYIIVAQRSWLFHNTNDTNHLCRLKLEKGIMNESKGIIAWFSASAHTMWMLARSLLAIKTRRLWNAASSFNQFDVCERAAILYLCLRLAWDEQLRIWVAQNNFRGDRSFFVCRSIQIFCVLIFEHCFRSSAQIAAEEIPFIIIMYKLCL